jgi:hypothetical protein
MLKPIPVGSFVADNGSMVKLTIRLHPSVPIDADELEGWLQLEVSDLRADAPHGTIRLSRLRQGLPNVDVNIGWLVELELPDGEPLLERDRLADALRDMRLLGLQPTLLAPLEVFESTSRIPPALALNGGASPNRGRA